MDIANYGAAHTVVVSPAASTAFVYADVAGRIFGGSGIVEKFVRPMGGGGGSGSSGTPVARMGQDVFRAYIDVNTASPQGAPILGIRADYYIEITGIYGHYLSKRSFEWSGSTWTASARTVLVANDRTRMEASLDLTGVTTGTMAMAIEATDWRLLSDDTGVYNFLGTHGGGTRDGPGLAPLHGTGAATAVAQPLSGAPTVDGNCGDSVYSGAGTFSDTGLSGKVGTSATYVYVCIDVTSDTTSESTDIANIYFDTQHNGGGTPQTDDRKFGVFSGLNGPVEAMSKFAEMDGRVGQHGIGKVARRWFHRRKVVLANWPGSALYGIKTFAGSRAVRRPACHRSADAGRSIG